MDRSPASAGAAPPAPDAEAQAAADPTPSADRGEDGEPLSKKAMKKKRRFEKAMAIKRRRKEQEREARRLKAKRDGRDLDAERRQQEENERNGSGWKRREDLWKQRMEEAKIEESFRVCFDCSFEGRMTPKEVNSLGLQLRYTYAANRKSPAPVYIDVCGLKKGGKTREGLERVEGFPERWVGRAFRCHEGGLEEIYGDSVGNADGGDSESVANDDDKNRKEEERNKQTQKSSDKNGDATKDPADGVSKVLTSDGPGPAPGEQPYPKLPPGHKFVYLTGDSPNTLNTLDNNTTYIIGGIVDRNRLKRATIDRARSINAQGRAPSVKTARLPLDENFDFRGSTRVLTCNHVFEILQRYREGGYKDWRGAIAAALPHRKDVEEKDGGAGGSDSGPAKRGSGLDEGEKGDDDQGEKGQRA